MGSLKILVDGVNSHDQLELVENEEESDYIFFDFRNAGNHVQFPQKTIMIDYSDSQKLLKGVYDKVFMNFKRSVCDKFPSRFHDYGDKNVIPISYIVKNEATKWDIKPLDKREIDVSVFFKPSGRHYRNQISNAIKNNFSKKYKVHTGILGECGAAGRVSIQKDYYNAMLNSKIVVTCNPQGWEGDWRLFEALSCCPLVLVDRMITPVKNKFIDGEHLIYYDVDNFEHLFRSVDYYLNRIAYDSQLIATNGKNHALQYHTAKGRMNEVLEELGN